MTHDRDLDRYERVLRAQGFARIAGVDEAGRGALAGPLVAAAVILPPDFDREGIDDSKVLTKNQREAWFERIYSGAIAVVVRKIEPRVIDERGLHRSNIALLRRCARALDPTPDYVLTDGFPVPRMPCLSLGIKKGDAVAASVAAASIVAKVTRDRIMDAAASALPRRSGSTTTAATGRRSTSRCSNGSGRPPSTVCRSRASARSRCPDSGLRTSQSVEACRTPVRGLTRDERRRHRAVRRGARARALPRVPRRPADVHVRDRDRAPLLPGESGRGDASRGRVGPGRLWPTPGSGTCSARRGSSPACAS